MGIFLPIGLLKSASLENRDSMGELLNQGRQLRQDDIMMLTYLKRIKFSIDGLIMLGETA